METVSLKEFVDKQRNIVKERQSGKQKVKNARERNGDRLNGRWTLRERRMLRKR